MGLGTGLNTARAHTMNREYVQRDLKSIYLEGSDDYINSGDQDDFSMTTGSGIANDLPFSIAGWVKATGTQSYGFVSKAHSSAGHHEYRAFMISGKMYFDLCTDNNTAYKRASTSSSHTYANVWVHYVLTYNGDATDDSSDGSYVKNGMSIYVNGVKQALNDGGAGSYDGMNNETSDLTWGFLLSDISYDLSGGMANLIVWKGYELTYENIQYLLASQPDGNYSVNPTVSANSGLYSIEAADACKLWIPADSISSTSSETVQYRDLDRAPPAGPGLVHVQLTSGTEFAAQCSTFSNQCWKTTTTSSVDTLLDFSGNSYTSTLVSAYSLSASAAANSPTLDGVGVINTLS